MVQLSRSLFFYFFFCTSVLCIIEEKGSITRDHVWEKISESLGQLSVLAGDQDLNELLFVLFSFIQAIVAVARTDAIGGVGHQFRNGHDQWSEWTACTKSCGGGVQQRTRGCLGEINIPEWQYKDRKEPLYQLFSKAMTEFNRRSCVVSERECNSHPCFKSHWSSWGDWSECYQNRTRSCLVPGACNGTQEETRPCIRHVEEYWSDWEEWGPCSGTCGTDAVQTRIRYSTSFSSDNDDIDYETRPCLPHLPPCPMSLMRLHDTQTWSSWSPCSRTCDGGVQTRRRPCTSEKTKNCTTEEVDSRPCASDPCPTWSNWVWVSSCSETCGVGTRHRMRMCLGEGCVGSTHQTVRCCNKPC